MLTVPIFSNSGGLGGSFAVRQTSGRGPLDESSISMPGMFIFIAIAMGGREAAAKNGLQSPARSACDGRARPRRSPADKAASLNDVLMLTSAYREVSLHHLEVDFYLPFVVPATRP